MRSFERFEEQKAKAFHEVLSAMIDLQSLIKDRYEELGYEIPHADEEYLLRLERISNAIAYEAVRGSQQER